MGKQTAQEMIEELRNFDTPSITNIVATYPNNPLCLGLYNPWTQNWYTDLTIRCMYPAMGPVVGYAVTAVYGLPDPSFNRLSFMDVVEALDATPRPTIFVFEQQLSGITPGHGTMAIHAVNVPVTIAGMDVAPGELIHMDENGAVKFPADRLEDVLTNVRKLRDQEAERMGAMQKATSLEEVRAIMSGHTYTEKK